MHYFHIPIAGNFATVHRGYYKHDPTQQIAIKVTRRNTNYNPERYRKYLEREIEFVRMKLQHPNVLQFIDYHDARTGHFFWTLDSVFINPRFFFRVRNAIVSLFSCGVVFRLEIEST